MRLTLAVEGVLKAQLGEHESQIATGTSCRMFSNETAIQLRMGHGSKRLCPANLSGEAAETTDARGKLVVPGLLSIHTHVARVPDGALRVLRDGVTGCIDAGSQGADKVSEVVAQVRSAPQPGRVLVNIGHAGLLAEGDTMDLSRADVAAARDAFAENRDIIAGVKARLSRDVAGPNKPLSRCLFKIQTISSRSSRTGKRPALKPTAAATSRNSATSKRRSPFSNLDTND